MLLLFSMNIIDENNSIYEYMICIIYATYKSKLVSCHIWIITQEEQSSKEKQVI